MGTLECTEINSVAQWKVTEWNKAANARKYYKNIGLAMATAGANVGRERECD